MNLKNTLREKDLHTVYPTWLHSNQVLEQDKLTYDGKKNHIDWKWSTGKGK